MNIQPYNSFIYLKQSPKGTNVNAKGFGFKTMGTQLKDRENSTSCWLLQMLKRKYHIPPNYLSVHLGF